MKILYEYRDWKTVPEDHDHPPVYTFDPKDDRDIMMAKTVCPEPACRRQVTGAAAAGIQGMIVFEGADGEPTGVAAPCADHLGFEYPPGWYNRFADAVEAERHPGGEKRTCTSCGEEYGEFLAGWASNQCPECTYQTIQGHRERTFAHAG